MRDDGLTIGCDRKFQDELILRIGQSRPPEKMDFLTVAHANVETTMIYTHVVKEFRNPARSPLDIIHTRTGP